MDSFVRFCIDLFSTVLKCIRSGGEMTTLFSTTRTQKSEIGFGRGRKREIHEYWVLHSTLRVRHTLDLPLFSRDPRQIRSSRKKVHRLTDSQKDPETALALQETE